MKASYLLVCKEKDLNTEDKMVCEALLDLWYEDRVAIFLRTPRLPGTQILVHIYTLIRKILLRLTFQQGNIIWMEHSHFSC